MDRECLQKLRVVDPQDDMTKIENKKDKLIRGAYQWVLHTEEYAAFTNWSDEPDRASCRMLWIKGLAGTGKTMLLIGIIRELKSQLSSPAPNVSHFFCQGTDQALNNATAALRSLIWLLLKQQPLLMSHLRKKYDDSGPGLFTDGNTWIALSEVFKSMLSDRALSPVCFVVDALDECDRAERGLEQLLQLISYSLTVSDKVRWLVSSRPEVAVQAIENPDLSKTIVELDTQRLQDPVNVYIQHRLTTLQGRPGYTDEILAAISAEVSQRAMNLFLWVALVFNKLDSVRGWDAIETLREIPPGLSALYDHMMVRISRKDAKDQQRCKDVLVAAHLAYRPLSLDELTILAGLRPEMTQTIVDLCGSFLTTNGETVSLIHQSAKDYLDANCTRVHHGGTVQGHAVICKRSIKAMSSVLERNMYNLDYSSKPQDAATDQHRRLSSIGYSCVFWVDHLYSGDRPDRKAALAEDGEVIMFLKQKFLYWLESLSLLGAVPDGLRAIQKLLHMAEVRLSSPCAPVFQLLITTRHHLRTLSLLRSWKTPRRSSAVTGRS